MKISSIILSTLLYLTVTPTVIAQVKAIQVTSPDHTVVYSLRIIAGKPEYAIVRNGRPVLDPAAVGLVINGEQVSGGKSIQVLSRTTTNETYPTRGIHSIAHNNYNAIRLDVNAVIPYSLEVRVFNDGVAFRYIVPNAHNAVIHRELTQFNIPAGSIIWSQDNITTYEGNYQQQKIEEVKPGQIAGPPLTLKLPGATGYASITEAGLIDFAGMSLLAEGNNRFKANLTGDTYKTGLIQTPWRVILIGGNLNQLVNSDVISNVSPPYDPDLFPKGYATDWIKPGKSVWSWLAGNGEVTFENMKRFTDWAAALGFDYNLVDEGWARWRDGDRDSWAMMKELVDYAKKSKVKIWAWKAYPDRAGVPGIKDSTARIAFFKRCQEIGIAGLKIDFFDTESQEVIKFYQAALKDAAKFHLMLNFHGANKPTGEARTWPNEMSREGVMGLENNTSWAKHNTTLLFTRFLAGHADYTPLSFTDNVKGTTVTHQVATVAAFNSPLMCLGVDPEQLLKSEVKTMVQQIPVVWDETIVLPQSEIGKLVLIVKRKGSDWFLVALNGEKPTKFSIDLSFLGSGTYQSMGLKDQLVDPEKPILTKGRYSHKSMLKITLTAGGGLISRFYK